MKKYNENWRLCIEEINKLYNENKNVTRDEVAMICVKRKVSRAIPSWLRKLGYIKRLDNGREVWTNLHLDSHSLIATKCKKIQGEYVKKNNAIRYYSDEQPVNNSNPVQISINNTNSYEQDLINKCKKLGWKVLIPDFREA